VREGQQAMTRITQASMMVVCAGKIETLKRSIEEVGSRRRLVTPAAAASATPRPKCPKLNLKVS
jgi:hypothetical protein